MNSQYLAQSFGLQGRTALVTGSASGIGLAIATALGHAGARVLINDLRTQAADEAVQSLRAQGIQAQAACFDVADMAAVKAAAHRLEQDGCLVDILVSNAGNQNRKALVEMSREEWQQIQDVHVGGAFNCSRVFLPGMCARGFGRVVMTSSVSGEATMPLIGAYSTAKAALGAMARAIAVEYGARGITANAIAPGFVRTEFTAGLQQREGFEDFLRQEVPQARWATPEDIAPVVLFLVSPAASYVNGQTLAIDGGLLAQM
ncbi:MAG: short-chain dehydrogenase [Comamonadaceae bacterium PBBC2]|nr:MAG: short-chain dehydrogenase [Comamonadaceae bacterium PBBC2]